MSINDAKSKNNSKNKSKTKAKSKTMAVSKTKPITENKVKTTTTDIFNDDFEVSYQEDHYSDLLRSELERKKPDNRMNNISRNAHDYHDEYDNYDNHDDRYNEYDDYDDAYDDYDGYDNEYDDYDDYDNEYDDYDDEYDDYDNEYDDYLYDRNYRGKSHSKKQRKVPNLVSPTAKTLKTGSSIIYKLINILLRCATLILTAVIIYILAVNFWKNHSIYGDVFRAFIEKNYIFAAYAAVAGFLLLFEFFTFLLILAASKKNDRRGHRLDTGRGLFSFIFIYAGSCLADHFNGWIPASPAPLQGVQGALTVYGTLHTTLLPLCIAGVISCLIRKFAIR